MKQPYGAMLFADAARKVGHSPFPMPAATLSQSYVNPLGMRLGNSVIVAFATIRLRKLCKIESTDLRAARTDAFPNFSVRTESEVLVINVDGTGTRDERHLRRHIRRRVGTPGDIILVCAFLLQCAMMLH